MKTVGAFLLVLLSTQAHTQEFYITSYDNTTFSNVISVVDSNLNVTPLNTFNLSGQQIMDIALASDGKLYGTLTNAIIELNVQDGTYTEVYEYPVWGQYNSLVCNSNRQIVALEYNTAHMVTIDLTTLTEVSDVLMNESSPGDLTYYKGHLIYQGRWSNNILGYNGTSLTTVECPVARPSGEPFLFYGLSNYTRSCEDNLVYGFSEDGHVFRHDIASNTNDEVGVLQMPMNSINGSTTINEYTASACHISTLNEVSCTVQVQKKQRPNISFYPNPVTNVIHIEDFDMQGAMSFTIYSTDGRKLTEGVLTQEIDFSQFPSGVYLMEINDKSKLLSTTIRVLKE